MLNRAGGIECDLVCARLSDDQFYLVTGTGFATHDFDHVARSLPAGLNAQLVDVTSSYAVLSLFGPNARAILQSVTSDDVGNSAFPSAHSRRSELPDVPSGPCGFPMSVKLVGSCMCRLKWP